MRATEKGVMKKRDKSKKKQVKERRATQNNDCRDGACILPNPVSRGWEKFRHLLNNRDRFGAKVSTNIQTNISSKSVEMLAVKVMHVCILSMYMTFL